RELGLAGEVHLDVRVMLFALCTSSLAGMLFGMLPLRQLVDRRLHDDLKQSGRGTSGQQRRVRAGLVSAQIALSVVLLVGAGLTLKSFARLQQVPAGFTTEGVLTA